MLDVLLTRHQIIHTMASDTTVLIIVLSCVFGFMFAVFLFLILRFTFRVRSMVPRSTVNTKTGMEQLTSAHRGHGTNERPLQWKERWSTRSRGGATAVRGVDDDEVDEMEARQNQQHAIIHDKTAGEFGATVHENGTRSYLNGW